MRKNNFYIIGETAFHHQGEIDYLYRMVKDLSELGIEAVKFHLLLDPKSYMQKNHPLLKELKEWIFNKKQWSDIIDYSDKRKLDVIVQCDDVEGIKYINKNNKDVAAVEVSATELNEWFLLEEVSKFKGPVILGIGGSTIDEIAYAIDFLKNKGKKEIILMYGFQNYPTNYKYINLSKMLKLKDLFKLPIGYADHTGYDDPNNEIISIMASMMGFNILEKHYTPDYGKKRIDYQSAVDKKQIIKIKELIKLALTVYGSGSLEMSEAELKYGIVGPMKKAIVARKFVKKGKKISPRDLWFKRTEAKSPLKQHQFGQLIGLKASRDIKEDAIIKFNMFESKSKNK